MGPRERRTREREETRSRILDAAREMFVQDGIEAVTMREIAKRIEYTPTAIYHHFRDKQALIEELCLIDFRGLAQAFQKIDSGGSGWRTWTTPSSTRATIGSCS